jgi:hypothetical protein
MHRSGSINQMRGGNMSARVQVIREVLRGEPGYWRLALQWGLYVYENGTSDYGYRFIWRRPDGSLQPARGQARLPSVHVIEELIARARAEGWGEHEG